MKPIQPVFEGEEKVVTICFASDENYAPYLKTALYSLLCNGDTSCCYDILILHKCISQNSQDSILKLSKVSEKVSIRFVDVTLFDEQIVTDVGRYWSVETNYRLFLLSELFALYDRVLYLDCDIVVIGDVSELYYCELHGNMAGAVKGVSLRYLVFSKSAMFVNNVPYNATNYAEKYLGLKDVKEYFNAGVILFDLKCCRERVSFEEVLSVLHEKEYCLNDQDVLNIIMDGNVESLDCKWNYTNDIEYHLTSSDVRRRKLYKELYRKDFKIVHYISANKPWNKAVPLDNYYKKYAKEMEEFYAKES